MTKKTSKTEGRILGTVHTTAASLHRAGVIDKATMRGQSSARGGSWP